MPKSRKIILKGKQRADADAQIMARVIIMLARHWVEQQESPNEDMQTGTARLKDNPEMASE